jgi:hypothetical protein
MTPIVHALRCSVVPLVLGAAALAVLLWPRQPAPVVVVVPVSISAPAAATATVVHQVPAWCYGYDWRYSSVDLRPLCGW